MLDVREVKPAPAACIIETDCEVDFEPPADYVPPAPAAAAALVGSAVPSDAPYGGNKMLCSVSFCSYVLETHVLVTCRRSNNESGRYQLGTS